MAKVTFSRIAIANLGPFKEQQQLDLEVRNGKPVVLVRALNGSGKTTLLTCIQVALYGSKLLGGARPGDYERLVAGMQRSDADGPSTVELDVRIEVNGETEDVTIVRTWPKGSDHFVERLVVLRGGSQDFQLTEDWDEYIDSILPAELAQLFLFDGERIESLANPRTLPDMLRRATEAFLGIGGIDSLSKDLLAVERRTIVRSRDQTAKYSEARSEFDALEAQQFECHGRVQELRNLLAHARTSSDVEQANLRRFTVNAQRVGLDSYQRAGELKSDAEHAQRRLEASLQKVREALADAYLPFSGLTVLWDAYSDRWSVEQGAEAARYVLDELGKRDRRVLKTVEREMPKESIAALRAALVEDSERYRKAAEIPKWLSSLADPATLRLRIEKAASDYKEAVAELHSSREAVAKSKRKVDSIPQAEQLRGLVDQLQERSAAVAGAEARVRQFEEQLAELENNERHLDVRLSASRARLSKDFKGQVQEQRAIAAGQRARSLLSQFKERLLASKATWLSEMITTEFKALMRKQRLVSRVSVDPDSYEVTIHGARGHELPMERLSAGERQLLAIAVLSALIKERKGRFPVVVDTPLARLDRQHRETLISRFFSRVSHQVMVLSTDEEVDDALFMQMERYTSSAYTLEYSDASHCTSVDVLERTEA